MDNKKCLGQDRGEEMIETNSVYIKRLKESEYRQEIK